jgi:virginiamycin A acetyltransferase
MREALKAAAHALAWIAVTPSVLSWTVRSRIVGGDRALEGSTQAWAIVPGLTGQYLRRAFLRRVLAFCASDATIEFGTLFSSASASIGRRAYIGPRCHLGWAVIEDEVLVAAGVHIPSGARTHGIDDVATAIRDQPTVKTPVRVGRGSWIGSAAIVMAASAPT